MTLFSHSKIVSENILINELKTFFYASFFHDFCILKTFLTFGHFNLSHRYQLVQVVGQ